jgi:flagellar motor protein MotB
MTSPLYAIKESVDARGVLLPALALALGCSNHLFQKPGTATPVNLVPPPGVAAPAATLPPLSASSATPLPSYADVDGRQVQTTLARSQDENQLLKDEITALREQLASTSNQLAVSRAPVSGAAATPWGMPGSSGMTGQASTGLPAGNLQQPGGPAAVVAGMAAAPAVNGPAAMYAAMGQFTLPGVESRFDGNVVRLELPADRLFDGGSATLLPGGTALLTQVAGEIDRLFPRHFVGIEGHVDTEPLEQSSWGSPHQLTAARAATVFDFFTTRTPLRQGQLFLVAHGGNHPVVSNATAAGRTRNRRVELVVYPERIGSERMGSERIGPEGIGNDAPVGE